MNNAKKQFGVASIVCTSLSSNSFFQNERGQLSCVFLILSRHYRGARLTVCKLMCSRKRTGLVIWYNTYMILTAIIFASLLPMCEFATNALNARLSATMEPQKCLMRFLDYPQGADNGQFTPNTNFWARGIDLSCASPWNSHGGRQRAGTLISKRHIIFANHFPLSPGTRILFVDNEGLSCPCHIVKTTPVPRSDIMIGLLNAEVTPNITPAKILPPDYENFIGTGEDLPVLTLNQNEEACLTSISTLSSDLKMRVVVCRIPPLVRHRPFRKPLIVGDSGNPIFLLLGKEAILISCVYGGGCGSGPALNCYRHEIQRAMDELCPGYKLECFDFSKLKL